MERLQQIETLIRRIEASADPETRAGVRELVESILEFHGAGLEKILEIVRQAGPAGEATVLEFAREPEVGGLMLLYGLHPEDFETRVRRAIDSVPYLELLDTAGGIVRVRTSSPEVSREAVEQIVYAAAPETAAVELDGAHSQSSAFVPVEALLRA
ncbi:MAG TPA: hypothetical protein VGH38_38270 [Bryobacteraceae bacterium]|jgi:hypothetical protein